jgi:hypothetical protein
MKKYLLLIILGSLYSNSFHDYSQGCVAIRQFSGLGNSVGQGNILEEGEWNISANYIHFKSFRHFRGNE